MATHAHTTPATLARRRHTRPPFKPSDRPPPPPPAAPYDFSALTTVTDHRDADLLDLIEQFTELKDTAWALIRRAERFKADGRLYKRLWREALSSHGERDRLERLICTTKAQTRLGVIAKGQLWLDLHSDNSGTMMDLPRAAITEAMAMLDGVGA